MSVIKLGIYKGRKKVLIYPNLFHLITVKLLHLSTNHAPILLLIHWQQPPCLSSSPPSFSQFPASKSAWAFSGVGGRVKQLPLPALLELLLYMSLKHMSCLCTNRVIAMFTSWYSFQIFALKHVDLLLVQQGRDILILHTHHSWHQF